MKVKTILFAVYLLILSLHSYSQNPDIIKGFTIVLPQKPYTDNPYDEIKRLGSNWVCITPFRFNQLNNTTISRKFEEEWWGLTPEGIEQSIIMAKEAGLKIMIKPQIYVEQSWPGEIDFKSEQEWIAFEKDYDAYISMCLDLAVKHKIDMFCIGTELKNFVVKRKKYWLSLIKNIKFIYKGIIIYSANWDNYKNIMFWDQLDLISISSYKPISSTKNPTTSLLIYNLQNYYRELRRFSEKNDKQILFSEYGFLSVEAAGDKHWELEKNFDVLIESESAQANAFDAIFKVFWNSNFWLGGFIWKWYPAGFPHRVPINKDYSVQNKSALKIIENRFKSK